MPPTTDTLTLAKLAAEILSAVNVRDCVAWVGGGLSRPIYDDWPAAVSKLCKACGMKDVDGSSPGTRAEQLIDKAEECKQANGAEYDATLARLYGRREVRTRHAYSYLIKAPFKAYVTTNFDPSLGEEAEKFNHPKIFQYPELHSRDLYQHDKPVFYIHGHARRNGAPNGKDLILARSEFDRAYDPKEGVVGLFVRELLLSNPIVFFGCRLSEPEIREQIRRVHSMHTQMKSQRDGFVPSPRVALLPTIKIEKSRDGPVARMERDYVSEEEETKVFSELDTHVLRYDAEDPIQHWEVETILQYLCDLTSKAPKVSLGEAGPK